MRSNPGVESTRVTVAVERLMAHRPPGKPADGVQWGLAEGYLGISGGDGRYEVIYDASLLDAVDLRERLQAEIGATADLVDFTPSRHSSQELVQLLRRIGAREWHPDAKRIAFGFGLNAREALVDVQVDESSAPDIIEALEGLSPGLVRVTAQGHLQRGGPRRGRPESRA